MITFIARKGPDEPARVLEPIGAIVEAFVQADGRAEQGHARLKGDRDHLG
jgi:hypothetical protein